MRPHLREDDQCGGPHIKDIFGTPRFKDILRAQDQSLGCPGFGHNGNTCKSPMSTVLPGLREASKKHVFFCSTSGGGGAKYHTMPLF